MDCCSSSGFGAVSRSFWICWTIAASGFLLKLPSIDEHDARDAHALMRVMRDEVVPLYYDRDRDGLPREWIARVKWAIRTLGWRFSADRMVMDYVQKAYIPAAGDTSSDVVL